MRAYFLHLQIFLLLRLDVHASRHFQRAIEIVHLQQLQLLYLLVFSTHIALYIYLQ
jgi:hypothetical protein